MSNALDFFVAGIPAPGGSKKGFAFRRKDGKLGVNMMPSNRLTAPWMAIVTNVAAEAVKRVQSWEMDGAFSLVVKYHLPRPKTHYRTGKNAKLLKGSAPARHLQRPDRGKLDRALEDALTGVAYLDDRFVYRIDSEKVWCDHYDGWPGAEVTLIREPL